MKYDQQQLAKGISVESEHRDLWEALKRGRPLSEIDIYAMIAKAHLREIPDYYTRLARMERAAKNAGNR